MSKLISVFEHEHLTIHDKRNKGTINKTQLDKLLAFNDNHDNKYFTAIRDGVKFTEYVGVIQIGNITIEILPKADKGDYNLWHGVLLKMLSVCKKINLETVSDANLSKRHFSLLDLYFDRFLNEVEKLLHKGLIKKYRYRTDNVFALKGQLQFAKNIQHNLVHQERFYTKHQTYDQEHLINQILLKALNILSKLVSNPFLTDKIKKLQLNFPEIKEISISKVQLDTVKLNRKSFDYSEAIQIAKMIILNYSPDIKGGNENMIALLFDMNKLWEEYIFRMLLKTPQNKFDISAQSSDKFWETKTIRPDIVLNCKVCQKPMFIIDTKWKVIKNTQPSDDDLKQMYAYNQYWNVNKSMLLYPQVESASEKFGKYHKGNLGNSYCKLGFVSVLKDGKLNQDIGQEILLKLKN